MVLPKSAGDPWLVTYANEIKTTPPPAAPLFDEVAPGGPVYRRSVTVPPNRNLTPISRQRVLCKPRGSNVTWIVIVRYLRNTNQSPRLVATQRARSEDVVTKVFVW